jgi:hypothetical protein
MGMGAPKPGQTIQGKGTGTVQPTVPPQGSKGQGQVLTPQQVQAVNSGQTVNVGGKGAGQPVQPGQPQSPYTPIGAQGGKGNMPLPPGVQMPIGYPPVQQPINSGMSPDMAAKYAEMERMRVGQVPGQVPAQGGKAPLTPEQHAAISANADPVRGLGLNLGNMLYGGGGQQPQVMPQKPGTPAPGLNGVPGNQNPRYFGPGKPAPSPAQVMPRPVPQVMPRQPTPKPAPQGLAQIQQMLKGRR